MRRVLLLLSTCPNTTKTVKKGQRKESGSGGKGRFS